MFLPCISHPILFEEHTDLGELAAFAYVKPHLCCTIVFEQQKGAKRGRFIFHFYFFNFGDGEIAADSQVNEAENYA